MAHDLWREKEAVTDFTKHIEWARNNYDTLKAETSLRDYIPIVWPVIEPGRKFVSGYPIDAICDHLQAVTEGHIRKLLINVPPGCMKSLTTCVLWPSWEWGPRNRPDYRYVCASYSDALTVRDNRRTRLIINSEEYQSRWGHRFNLVGDQNAKTKFETNQRGFKIATSVRGLGTGERGDRVIVDDPHNVKDGESTAKREEALAWFTETMPTRVNDADTAAFVVIMQRVHERDVSGLILANELGYDHLMLPMEFDERRRCYVRVPLNYMGQHQKPEEVVFNPRERCWQKEEHLPKTNEGHDMFNVAELKRSTMYSADWRESQGELLWPQRFSESYLENDLKPSLRAWGGGYAEAGQLQQSPIPRGGGMFNRDDIKFLEPSEVKDLRGRIVRGWDLAASDGQTSSYTAGVKAMIDQHGRFIVLDVVRDRKLSHGVKKMLKSCGEQDGKLVEIDIPQDPGQAGKAQKADLAAWLHGYNVKFSPESGDKVVRATPVSSQAEAGNMYLVRAPWNDSYLTELCVFPNGQFKDQTDATSRAYANLIKRGEQKTTFGPKIIEAA